MSSQHQHEQVPHLAIDQLRQHGWAVAQVVGNYCVAWRGNREVTFTWQEDQWRVVSSKRGSD